VTKSTSIIPAISGSLGKQSDQRPPITVVSPNVLELAQMHEFFLADFPVLTPSLLGTLRPQFQMDLEGLARRSASDGDASQETLSFLLDEEIAHKGLSLLPFFQTIVVKCGHLGVVVILRIPGPALRTSGWACRRSDLANRYITGQVGSPREMVVLQHFPAFNLPNPETFNVTGAGDTLIGSILASLLQDPLVFQGPQSMKNAIDSAQRAAVLTLQSPHAVSPHLSDGTCAWREERLAHK
jgi:pseudouridylate synthase / pseudouridine kinase